MGLKESFATYAKKNVDSEKAVEGEWQIITPNLFQDLSKHVDL